MMTQTLKIVLKKYIYGCAEKSLQQTYMKVTLNKACPRSKVSLFENYHVLPRFHVKTYFFLISQIATESNLIVVSD